MKPNPILEEVWWIKDDLAREAGHDLHRHCENVRQWVAGHPPSGQVVRNAAELRQLLAEDEHPHHDASALVLQEEPPQKNE